jgi:DnaJ family protein A protein 5
MFPSFGFSTWKWSSAKRDDDKETARTFYNAWLNFTTSKEFSWADQWNTAEAPDRRIRRLMERDNKKARDEARGEYNDTVKVVSKHISSYHRMLIYLPVASQIRSQT